jgi:hypothetical protein
MLRVLSAIIKIGLASLATGVVLSALNMSAAELLAEIGLTPENVFRGFCSRARPGPFPTSCSAQW